MKEVKHKGHTLVMYDSIDDLPIRRFQALNLNLALDAGIGSDQEAVTRHSAMIRKFIQAGQTEEALVQLNNYEQCLTFIVQGINPKLFSFVCLLHKLDGKLITDLTEEGIKQTLDKMDIANHSFITNLMLEAKKKLYQELEICFPKLSKGTNETRYWNALKNNVIYRLKKVAGQEVDDMLEKIELGLLNIVKPKIYAGTTGIEVKNKKSFENLSTKVDKEFNVNTNDLNVFQFYSRVEQLMNKK
jgi:hypothetical protein